MHITDSTEWADKTDKVYEWEFMMIAELENRVYGGAEYVFVGDKR